MKENILNKITKKVSSIEEYEKYEDPVSKIYSYIVYVKYEDAKPVKWNVEYNVSQTEAFNTLDIVDVRHDIIKAMKQSVKAKSKQVLCYGQPPSELLFELYDPLIQKLAREQARKWNEIEYEDAYQTCRYCLMLLYTKNYYIHKSILARTFNNHILLMLRKERNKPEILSFNQPANIKELGEESLTLADVVPDLKYELEIESKEEKEVLLSVFAQVKKMIIDIIGERQYEQLYRDYANKHTTDWSRKMMQRLKKRFAEQNIKKRWEDNNL